MNICTTNFNVLSSLGWGHMRFHEKENALAEKLCYKAKQEGKTALALLEELANNNLPFEFTKGIWTGDYEGKIFRNKVLKIKIGTEGTELWVYCN